LFKFDYQIIKPDLNMKKYFLQIALGLSMCAALAFKVDDTHLKGYIDDSMCAASATPKCTPATRVECAKHCIKMGASAVLVVGDKVYKIANQKKVLKYAGKNVEVDGTVNGDTIEVSKIAESKS
jgi:hypothetical protein